MSDDIALFSARALLDHYRSGNLSPVEVTRAVIHRIERLNPRLNAFYLVDPEGALAEARLSEERWRSGRPKGLLDGVPVSIKDSIKVIGFPTYRGCEANSDSPPSTVDAPPTARLREQSAIIIGKTTMPDFGLLAAGLSSRYGITRNPWNLDRSTGGSSSGGGAALAAALGPLSVGSDLGGSVRIPAAFCGLVGLKPSQGRLPHVPASSMRSAGPMARTVADVTLMMNVLTRPDRRDYMALPFEERDYGAESDISPRGMRLGLLLDMGFGRAVDPEIVRHVEAAASLFEQLGAVVEPIAPPFRDDPEPAIEAFFRSRTLAEYNAVSPERRSLVLPAVADWCQPAAALSAQDLLDAMDRIDLMRKQINDAFTGYDFVLSPTMPMTAYGAETPYPDPRRIWAHLHFTFAYNQTQQPAATLNCGFDGEGLPIGLQIIGQRFDDVGVLRMAGIYERARPFQMSWPDL